MNPKAIENDPTNYKITPALLQDSVESVFKQMKEPRTKAQMTSLLTPDAREKGKWDREGWEEPETLVLTFSFLFFLLFRYRCREIEEYSPGSWACCNEEEACSCSSACSIRGMEGGWRLVNGWSFVIFH